MNTRWLDYFRLQQRKTTRRRLAVHGRKSPSQTEVSLPEFLRVTRHQAMSILNMIVCPAVLRFRLALPPQGPLRVTGVFFRLGRIARHPHRAYAST